MMMKGSHLHRSRLDSIDYGSSNKRRSQHSTSSSSSSSSSFTAVANAIIHQDCPATPLYSRWSITTPPASPLRSSFRVPLSIRASCSSAYYRSERERELGQDFSFSESSHQGLEQEESEGQGSSPVSPSFLKEECTTTKNNVRRLTAAFETTQSFTSSPPQLLTQRVSPRRSPPPPSLQLATWTKTLKRVSTAVASGSDEAANLLSRRGATSMVNVNGNVNVNGSRSAFVEASPTNRDFSFLDDEPLSTPSSNGTMKGVSMRNSPPSRRSTSSFGSFVEKEKDQVKGKETLESKESAAYSQPNSTAASSSSIRSIFPPARPPRSNARPPTSPTNSSPRSTPDLSPYKRHSTQSSSIDSQAPHSQASTSRANRAKVDSSFALSPNLSSSSSSFANAEWSMAVDVADSTRRASMVDEIFDACQLSNPRSPSPSPFSYFIGVGSNQLVSPIIAQDEGEMEAKRAEKRRRTIRELLETEASYASDMAVVRDIYLARARGGDIHEIADYVMSTGLGLGRIAGVARESPPLTPGLALMTSREIHIVFANLEEITGFAELFAGNLEAGRNEDSIGEVFLKMIPGIQQIYSVYCARHHRAIVMLQELEPSLRLYLAECKSLGHGRTTAWDLASLLIKPVQRCLKYPLLLDQILAFTPKEHPDRSNLERASREMLLVAAHMNEVKKRQDIVGRIISKKRDPPGRLRDANQRSFSSTSAPSASSSSSFSFGRTVTKTFSRSSMKMKQAVGLIETSATDDDEAFDVLAGAIDSARSAVLRFSNEMRDWSKKTREALDSQMALVQTWKDAYAPIEGERMQEGSGYERLSVFMEQVLRPVITETWQSMDNDIRTSLLVKTSHLVTLFENPRIIIKQRNDGLLEHAQKLANDRRGSENFLLLTAQLLEELPRFLGSVRRYFGIIVAHFVATQAEYHKGVDGHWRGFAKRWSISMSGYEYCEQIFQETHSPAEELMKDLAQQLGVTSPATSPEINRTNSISTFPSLPRHRSNHRASQSSSIEMRPQSFAGPMNSTRNSQDFSAADFRNSMSSVGSSTTPSFGFSSTTGSSTMTSTPPARQPSQFELRRSSVQSSSSSSAHRLSKQGSHYFTHTSRKSMKKQRPSSIVSNAGSYYSFDATIDDGFRASTYETTDDGGNEAEEEDDDENDDASRVQGNEEEEEQDCRAKRAAMSNCDPDKLDRLGSLSISEPRKVDRILYRAAAMHDSTVEEVGLRSGVPILFLRAGEHFDVHREEADSTSSGGSGWLLGRLMETGEVGYSRTESLYIV